MNPNPDPSAASTPSSTTGAAGTPSKTSPASARKNPATPEGPRDTTREIFETVVFVVVLVLLLKLFVAEAFVIPTGSMATTLWGDQVICTCRECKHSFPINASEQGRRIDIRSYTCENCGYMSGDNLPDIRDDLTTPSSGDRVLVSKYIYHLRSPRRFEVAVFKYPVEPFSNREQQAMNYIKRIVGLGNETIAVFSGDLYRSTSVNYSNRPQPEKDLDRLLYRYMYPSDPEAIQQFKEGKFEIIRKSPEQILSMRRIVFDLDHQPSTPTGIRKQRWHPVPEESAGWTMLDKGFRHEGDATGWVRYQHINPWDNTAITPHLIGDTVGYNERLMDRPFNGASSQWVPDLILECEVEIPGPESEVVLELNKATDRFQARFVDGKCELIRIVDAAKGGQPAVLGSRPTKLTEKGKYKLRLANVDSRLVVWVDGKVLPFDPRETDFDPPPSNREFKSTEMDLTQPARIGARGNVVCSKVRLWRDTYYTCADRPNPLSYEAKPYAPSWDELVPCSDFVQTFYVQPGHYLCFGDNSKSSLDSRLWGLVPDRLMLGRAVMVYWPMSRVGVIE